MMIAHLSHLFVDCQSSVQWHVCSWTTAVDNWETAFISWAFVVISWLSISSARPQLLTSFCCRMTSCVDCDDVSWMTVITHRLSCSNMSVITAVPVQCLLATACIDHSVTFFYEMGMSFTRYCLVFIRKLLHDISLHNGNRNSLCKPMTKGLKVLIRYLSALPWRHIVIVFAIWWIRLNLCFLRFTRVRNPNGKSIASAVLAHLKAGVLSGIFAPPG